MQMSSDSLEMCHSAVAARISTRWSQISRLAVTVDGTTIIRIYMRIQNPDRLSSTCVLVKTSLLEIYWYIESFLF